MGRAALRLIRADLRARRAQALLTGLVVAIAAGTLVVTFYLRGAFDDPWEHLMRATNGPDAVVDGAPEALAGIARLPAVAQADAVRPVVDVPARLSPMPARLTVVGLPARPVLDRPLVSAGRLPRAPGELLLDRAVAEFHRVAPGKIVAVGRERLRVVGIATAGRFAGGAWATARQVRALAPGGKVTRATVPLRLHDADAPLPLRGADVRVGRASEWRADFTDSAERRLTLMTATTLFALLGTAFTLATAIGGRVIAQRRQVALLRAVGLTPRQAMLLLVGFYAALAAVAAPPGLVLGALLGPALLEDTSILGTSPSAPGGGLVLAAFATTLLVVVAATALPAWRAGRRSPVAGLALGRDVTTARASRLAALARRLRLPVVVGLGVKDAFAQRARSLLTLGSLVLAAMIGVCALAFESTMDRLLADPALRAQPWDVRITPSGVSPAQGERLAEAAVARVAGARVARVDELQLTAAETGIEVRGRVVDGPLGAFRFAVPDGRGIDGAGEITAGRGLLDALGAEVGDTVGLSAGGAPFRVRIVGRHVEPDADGRALVIAYGSLPRVARELVDDPDWVLALPPGADAAAVQAEVARTSGGRLQATRPVESIAREAGELRPIVYGVTGLLVAIGLVNLLTTLLLGLRERERDVGILGAVGATPRQVAGSVLAGGAALAIPAVLIGIPAGAWVFTFLIGRTDPSDGPDVATLPSVPLLALALPAALAAAVAVSALAARQARAIDPVRALRAE
jgi:putative ABC transport system permease protein